MTSSYDSYYDSYVRSFNEGFKNFIQKSPEQRNTELVQYIANTTIQTFFQIMNINNSSINIEENIKKREKMLPILIKTGKSPEEIEKYLNLMYPIQKKEWNLLEFSEKFLQSTPNLTDSIRRQAMELIREFHKNQEK